MKYFNKKILVEYLAFVFFLQVLYAKYSIAMNGTDRMLDDGHYAPQLSALRKVPPHALHEISMVQQKKMIL